MGVSEDFQNSEAMSTGESRNTGSGEAWSSDGSVQPSIPMVSSDTTFTTWNKLKKCTTSDTKNPNQLNNEVILRKNKLFIELIFMLKYLCLKIRYHQVCLQVIMKKLKVYLISYH